MSVDAMEVLARVISRRQPNPRARRRHRPNGLRGFLRRASRASFEHVDDFGTHRIGGGSIRPSTRATSYRPGTRLLELLAPVAKIEQNVCRRWLRTFVGGIRRGSGRERFRDRRRGMRVRGAGRRRGSRTTIRRRHRRRGVGWLMKKQLGADGNKVSLIALE